LWKGFDGHGQTRKKRMTESQGGEKTERIEKTKRGKKRGYGSRQRGILEKDWGKDEDRVRKKGDK